MLLVEEQNTMKEYENEVAVDKKEADIDNDYID
jgi:hypothetical protein